MKGGETVVNNLNLLASAQVSKPNNSSRKSDLTATASERAYSFKDSLKEAAGSIHKNDNSSVRKQMVSKSETKLKVKDKPDTSVEEETGNKPEAKEEQLEKIVNKLEELLLKLQELAGLQQTGEVPAEKQTELLEGIKDAFQELTAFQSKLVKLEASQQQKEIPALQTKMTEVKTLLEGILNELKADGDFTDSKNSSNFLQKLEAIIEETLPKLDAVTDSLVKNVKVQPDSNKLENIKETTREPKFNELDKAEKTQGQEKTESKVTEAHQTGENAENLNNEIKSEAAGAENRTLIKKTDPEATENTVTEDEKIALEGKTAKVTVEGKGSRRQDTESETGKEASKEVPMTANTKQNKPVTADITAMGQEQTVIKDKTDIMANQMETPKTQTLSRAEIINQIVKKAEILFTDAQSEMRMQLEPENLGKLTLKIAVERGLITAKFTAENNEVKQIIESSFNELKDMLQEKGLEVQNFSVSVGQDSRENDNSNAFQQWKETVKLNGSNLNKGGYEGYLNTEAGTRQVVNPYSIHNGKFDHIA